MHTVQGDISHAATAQRIIEETLDRFGRIDTLMNNAGIFIGKPFLQYTDDDFAAMRAVNLSKPADTSSTSPRASSITRASPRHLPWRR